MPLNKSRGLDRPLSSPAQASPSMRRFTQPVTVVDRRRFPWLQSTAVSIFIVWLLLPQFRAFPEDGTLAERDAWTEQHVPQYASLKRTVEKIPVIRESVGRIVGIAPTSGAKHIAAVDMDG